MRTGVANDKTREQFEKWDRAQYEIDPETYARKYQGRYMDRAIQCRWECWAASRAQALNEAQAACKGEMLEEPTDTPDDIAYDLAVRDCIGAIRNLGSDVGSGRKE